MDATTATTTRISADGLRTNNGAIDLMFLLPAAIGTGRSREPAPSLRRENVDALLVHHFERPPPSTGDAGEGVVGNNDRNAGLFHQ